MLNIYQRKIDTLERRVRKLQREAAATEATELRVSKALGGMPESELWGDDGLIAATMRIVDAYEASSQWQEIESAPKDGTEIECYDRLHKVCIISWHEEIGRWKLKKSSLIVKPECWQPLPEPPAE